MLSDSLYKYWILNRIFFFMYAPEPLSHGSVTRLMQIVQGAFLSPTSSAHKNPFRSLGHCIPAMPLRVMQRYQWPSEMDFYISADGVGGTGFQRTFAAERPLARARGRMPRYNQYSILTKKRESTFNSRAQSHKEERKSFITK